MAHLVIWEARKIVKRGEINLPSDSPDQAVHWP
jgi:hypothetical protein